MAEQKRGQGSSATPDWVGDVLKVVAGALIGGIATIVVGYFTFFNAGRELDQKMVDISLAILSGQKGGVTTQGTGDGDQYYYGRLFALRTLSKYSQVEIPAAEMAAWAKSGAISFGSYPTGQSPFGTTSPSQVDLTTVKFVRLPGADSVDIFALDRSTSVFGVVQTLQFDVASNCFEDDMYAATRTSKALRDVFMTWVAEKCPNGKLHPRDTAPSSPN
jgi:hypothetical protein